MLESEAKKKICPHFAQVAALGVISMWLTPDMNLDTGEAALDILGTVGANRCKGSDCMMWTEHNSALRGDKEPVGNCGLKG